MKTTITGLKFSTLVREHVQAIQKETGINYTRLGDQTLLTFAGGRQAIDTLNNTICNFINELDINNNNPVDTDGSHRENLRQIQKDLITQLHIFTPEMVNEMANSITDVTMIDSIRAKGADIHCSLTDLISVIHTCREAINKQEEALNA